MRITPKHPIRALLLVLLLGFAVIRLLYLGHANSPELVAQKLFTQNGEPAEFQEETARMTSEEMEGHFCKMLRLMDKEGCQDALQIAWRNNEKLCDTFPTSDSDALLNRQYCYVGIAVLRGDIQYCEEAVGDVQSDCIATVAAELDDPQLCLRFSEGVLRSACVGKVAAKSNIWSCINQEGSGSTQACSQRLARRAEFCDILSGEEKKLCVLQVALREENNLICGLLDYRYRSFCNSTIARRSIGQGKNELSDAVCDTNAVDYTDCVTWISSKTGISGICDLVSDGTRGRYHPFDNKRCRSKVVFTTEWLLNIFLALISLAPFIALSLWWVLRKKIQWPWLVGATVGGLLGLISMGPKGASLPWIWPLFPEYMFLGLFGRTKIDIAWSVSAVYIVIANALLHGSIVGIIVEQRRHSQRSVAASSVKTPRAAVSILKSAQGSATSIKLLEAFVTHAKSNTVSYILSAIGVGIYIYLFVIRGAFNWCSVRPYYGQSINRAPIGYTRCVLDRVFLDPFSTTIGVILLLLIFVLLKKRAGPIKVFLSLVVFALVVFSFVATIFMLNFD